jgi:DNA repair photolyase
VSNPPNPYLDDHIDWDGEPPPATLTIYEEQARSALTKNASPDVDFDWSLNPYRGCFHGCAYCYARTTHQYLGLGAGTDFERKIVVKPNIAEVLRRELSRPSWKGERVALSGNTDCYQPLEAAWGLSRQILEVCWDFRQPLLVITKGATVIRRDLDLLADLARDAQLTVTITVPFARDETARLVEPGASPPSKRFETMRLLTDRGVPVGLAVAPLIPGLNEEDIVELLERGRAAGARWTFTTLLRLPAEVGAVFDVRIEDVLPGRAKRIHNTLDEMRGGKRNESRFGKRMVGEGARWEATRALFDLHARRLGYGPAPSPPTTTFRRPTAQLSLF